MSDSEKQPLNDFRFEHLERSQDGILQSQKRMELAIARIEQRLEAGEKLRADVDDLKAWRYYIIGAGGALSTLIAFVVNHFWKH